jgi:Fe-S cluster assembly protein SufB
VSSERQSVDKDIDALLAKTYRHGFVTDIDSDTLPPGLDEDVVRFISRKKKEPEFLTNWRLKAYRHWLTMKEPHWAKLRVNRIDYQAISYFSAPKQNANAPKSLEEVDPKLLATYEKLGVPLHERARLAGVAVDACSTASRWPPPSRNASPKPASSSARSPTRCRTIPRSSRNTSALVVPHTDNFFAGLNSAVFSDGSFVYVPPGVRCPMELSTYFRINAKNTGQFERTLIIAAPGSHVSYLEGCTAPMRDENQLHAAVVDSWPKTTRRSSTPRCRTGIGRRERRRRHLQLRDQAR